MLSLKKMTKLLLVFIMTFILVALFLNFILVPSLQDLNAKNHQSIEEVNAKIAAIELPMRVLDNILSQYSSGVSTLKLEEAFERNKEILYTLSGEASGHLTAYLDQINEMNRMSFKRHNPLVVEMTEKVAALDESLKRMEQLSKGSGSNTMPFDIISGYYTKAAGLKAELKVLNETLTKATVEDITFILNIIFISLILILIIITAGVIKYALIDQPYILSLLSHMERHQYRHEQLPRSIPFFKEEIEISKLVKEIFEEEQFTKEVEEIASKHYIVDDLVEVLFEKINLKIGIDRVGVAFVDYGHKKFIAEIGVASFENIKLGPGFEVPFSRTTLSRILYDKKAFISDDLEAEINERPNSDALRLLREEGIRSNMVVPVMMGDAVFGLVFFSSKSPRHFTQKDLKLAEKVISEISGLLNRAYFTKIVFSNVTNSFAELVDKKDDETGDHIERMVRYSVVIAEGLRRRNVPGYEVSRKFVLEIERNASAHDIGKVGVPDEILKKPGKLSPDEWAIMKQHVDVGADVFSLLREGLSVFDADFYRFAEEIARYHHERWDGSGYPQGLKGDEIPLSARIVAVADVFDALTSKRHYKESFSFERSVAMIRESAGSHLDPFVVEIFVENLDRIWRIYHEAE